jgi:hypothetical protein
MSNSLGVEIKVVYSLLLYLSLSSLYKRQRSSPSKLHPINENRQQNTIYTTVQLLDSQELNVEV